MSSLSLLSRGTGQVVRKKQEKLEVHFDPEDYLNWKKSSETHCHVSRLPGNGQVLEGYWQLYLPKTYSTKTGALVLYSEDLARRSRKLKGYERPQQRLGNKSRTLHIELYTLQDLVRAILAYGGKQLWKNKKGIPWQPYLHFLRDPEAIQAGRQMRPGYSAKRYLLKLYQTLEPSILEKLQCAGYIRDPLLLEKNSSDHRKKQQDLSAVPPKYNLHILCSPCSYLPTEFEQQTNPGLDPSFHKRSGTKAWVLEGYKEETWARRRAPVPLRLSVRKLSFQRTPKHSKETTWRQNAAYRGVPEDTCMEVPQDGGNTKEDQGHHKMPNQSVDCSSFENTSMDTSELWCERAHVTFYGGCFSGRKISCSVGQKHPKNPDCREREAPVETGLFPPVQPRRSSGQDGERKEHRKQVPEMVRLPQIPEDAPRAQRKKLKSSELSKELVVLPLLVQLEREPRIRAKKPEGACCSEAKSEVTLGDKLLAPLLNDLISEPEHRNKQHQIINGGIPEAPQDLQDAVPSIGLLPTIDPNKYPGTQSNRDNFKPSTVINTGIGGTNQDFPVGIPHRERRGPDGEIGCPVLLGSVQTAADLGHWGFIPDEEDDGEVSLERRTVSINPPKTSAVAQEQDRKEVYDTPKNEGSTRCANKRLETLKTQTGPVQETKKGLEDEQNTMGNVSTSAEFSQGTQQRQDDDDRNSQWLQRKKKKRHSSLQRTGSPGQKDGGDFEQDAGKQLDNLPQSESLSHLEPPLAHMTISSSHMVPVPESDDGNLSEMPSHSEAIEGSTRTGLLSSEEALEMEEVEQMTLPKKTSKQAKARLHAARDVSDNKPMSRQEKDESAKTGAGSKPPKKSPKKDKRPSQAEFVVGKPHQKKAVGKRASNHKVKPAGVNVPVITEEPSQEEKGDAEVEEKLITCLGGGEELGSPAGQSPSPSSSLKEEPSSPLEEGPPPSADAGHDSRSQVHPAQEMLQVSQPAVSATSSPQTDAVLSSEMPEVLLPNKQEERLSRDRLIAERAEQRRLAVEKKRREKEELKRKQQEQQERMERMKEEMEEEQQRRLEEMRLRRQQREEELQRQEEEAARMFKAERAAQERAQQQQEEQRRKLLEMQKKRQQEEKERAEAEQRRQKEREMQLEEERRLLAEMAEEERLAFEKRKQEEEEEARRLAEEKRKKAKEEAKFALEEARKQAVLLARQRAELEEKQHVQNKLFVEATGLEQGQAISRPWVYSYFQHPFIEMGDDD